MVAFPVQRWSVSARSIFWTMWQNRYTEFCKEVVSKGDLPLATTPLGHAVLRKNLEPLQSRRTAYTPELSHYAQAPKIPR